MPETLEGEGDRFSGATLVEIEEGRLVPVYGEGAQMPRLRKVGYVGLEAVIKPDPEPNLN